MHASDHVAAAARMAGPAVCPRCSAAIDATARFCAHCGIGVRPYASENPSFDAATGNQRRQITLLFCDLVDSTRLSEALDPEDLTQLMSLFHRAISDVAREFEGFAARHVGDEAVLYFGYPEAHEDDAERAVKAALRALQAVADLPAPGGRLHAHIGIATGLVVVGDIVGAGGPGIDVAGATANLAARLEALAPADSILVSDTTRRLVGDLVEWRDLGPLAIKGVSEPVRAWQALALRPTASRFDALHGGALAPLLGREREFGQVQAAWNSARDGHGRVVLITGEAGIGKSRLAAQVLDALRDHPHRLLRYDGSARRRHTPLHPWVQQLEVAAGFARDDDARLKLDKLERALAGASPRDVQLIAEFLLIATAGRFPVLQLGPQRRRQLLLEALLGIIERASAEQPVVVLFEDAHWTDASSAELLGRMVAACGALRCLLLVTARPEFDPQWATHGHVLRLALEPLDDRDGSALVRWVAGGEPLEADVVEDIVARSDGLPLHLEELTRAVLDGPSIGGLREVVPISLHASLQARLDRLGDARHIAELAACLGRVFVLDVLTLAADRPAADVRAAVERLVASALVVPRTAEGAEGEAYAFRHVLLRDLAHRGLVRSRRRALHARVAEVIERHFPSRAAAHPDLMAHHYTEGGLVEKAVGAWLQAGVLAMRRSAMGEALGFLRRGLDAVAQLPPGPWARQQELALTTALGQAQIATQGYAVEGTRQTFERALQLSEGLEGSPQLLSVMHGLYTHALMRGDLAAARQRALTVLEGGHRRQDPLWLLMGHRFCGVSHYPLGAFAESIAYLRRGLELYVPAQRAAYGGITVDDPEIVMLTYLSWSLMCSGEFQEAREVSARALDQARAIGHVYSLAHALVGAAFVALTIESPQAALVRIAEMLPLLEEHGIAYYGAVGTLFRGWCLASLGEHGEARSMLEQGLKAYRATGSRLYLSGFLRMSAEAYVWAHDVARARACIEESFQIIEATQQRYDEGEAYRVRAAVERAAGDRQAAVASLEQARASSERLQAGLWHLRATCDLAELLAERGDRATAQRLLEGAVARHARQPSIADVARMRAMASTLP